MRDLNLRVRHSVPCMLVSITWIGNLPYRRNHRSINYAELTYWFAKMSNVGFLGLRDNFFEKRRSLNICDIQLLAGEQFRYTVVSDERCYSDVMYFLMLVCYFMRNS